MVIQKTFSGHQQIILGIFAMDSLILTTALRSIGRAFEKAEKFLLARKQLSTILKAVFGIPWHFRCLKIYFDNPQPPPRTAVKFFEEFSKLFGTRKNIIKLSKRMCSQRQGTNNFYPETGKKEVALYEISLAEITAMKATNKQKMYEGRL